MPTIDPKQTKQIAELKHAAPLLGARIDPGGRFVFAGAQDSGVQRWELAGGKKTTLAGHASWVRAIAFADKLVLTGDYHGQLLAWPLDADAPKPVKSVAAHDGWVRATAVSGDGRRLATCGNDGLVKLWSLPDLKPLRSLAGHGCHVYNVAFRPDGGLVSADLKGVVKVWDAAGKPVRDLDAKVLHKHDDTFRAEIGGARGLAVSADGQRIACAGITEVSNAFAGVGKPLVVLFAGDGPPRLLRPKEAFQGTAWGVAFFPAGHVIAAGGGSGGAVWFWDLTSGDNVHTLKLPNNARDLAPHPDGKRFAVPFADGVVRVYDTTPKA